VLSGSLLRKNCARFPYRHFPLEKIWDALLRHVRIAPRDDGAESTAPSSISAQSTSTSDLSITFIPHWSCSTCLTEYTAQVSIMREDPPGSSSNSAESQPPGYCLDKTAWINLGALNFYSWNSESNFGRHRGDDRGNTKSWLVKSSDWVFNNGSLGSEARGGSGKRTSGPHWVVIAEYVEILLAEVLVGCWGGTGSKLNVIWDGLIKPWSLCPKLLAQIPRPTTNSTCFALHSTPHFGCKSLPKFA
jgi:hypothetical protein